MILLAIMLFMIGQALNMTTAYWVVWGLFIFFGLIFNLLDVLKKNRNEKPSYIEERMSNKIDEILEEVKEEIKEEMKED